MSQAETAWQPYAADNHLAEFAADVLETVLDLPVLVRTNPDDAPDISPCVLLSQRTPTVDYGQFSPSGAVAVRVVGHPEIDWRSVELAFEDTGSDVQVSSDRITFKRVAYPMPVLFEPRRGEVRQWADTFAQAWVGHVERFEFADRMRAAGYMGNGATGFRGFSRVNECDLTWGDGNAVGVATVSLATTEGLTIGELQRKAERLVAIFASEQIGTHTPAGEIVSIEMVEATAGDRTQWNGTFYRLPPQTTDLKVQLSYQYAVPAGQIAGD